MRGTSYADGWEENEYGRTGEEGKDNDDDLLKKSRAQ